MAKKKGLLTKKQIEELLRPTIEKVKKDMAYAGFDAMKAFYNDYTPTIYDRSYGMYGILLNEIEEKSIPNGIELFFKYSASDIEKPDHHGDVSAVFALPFMQGYHGALRIPNGVSLAFTPRLRPSPWERIVSYAKKNY